jgi:hypothetical protein
MRTKKNSLLSILFCLSLILGMSLTAFADNTPDGSLTDTQQTSASEEDKKAADDVTALLNNLPDDPKDANKADAQAAYTAYMALTDSQKALLGDDANEKVAVYKAFYEAQYADKKAADNVTALVSKLPDDPNKANTADAQAAYAAFMALTDSQKALLSDNVNKKVAVYKAFYETQYAKAKKAKLVSAKAKKNKKIIVKWKSVSGVSGYQLYYKAKGTKAKKVAVNSNKTLKKTFKKLKAGKKYTFKVRTITKVYDPTKGKSVNVYGKWSNAKKATAKK